MSYQSAKLRCAQAIASTALLLTLATGAFADADKSQYHLFNPIPPGRMREMSTDRPDTTESPYTVDAGHFQVELSFFDYTRDGSVDQLSFLPINLKLGLTSNADLQLVLEPYTSIDSGEIEGLGDTQLRLKTNLFGNDGGGVALAVMPFIQFPTGDDELSSGKIEGGVIFPAAFDLGGGWGLGVQAEIDFVLDDAGEDYGVALLHSAALGRDIAGELAGYVEYIGIASSDLDRDYEAYLGGGLTYGITGNLQLDLGVNVGLTDAAADVNLFSGLSFRH